MYDTFYGSGTVTKAWLLPFLVALVAFTVRQADWWWLSESYICGSLFWDVDRWSRRIIRDSLGPVTSHLHDWRRIFFLW